MLSPGQKPSERRRHPRLDHAIALKISSQEADFITETKNLSCSGALCLIDKFITPMTKLKLNFLLPIKRNHKTVNKKIACQGVVVRCENIVDQDAFLTAIFFNDISLRDSQVIHEFMDYLMHSHGSSK